MSNDESQYSLPGTRLSWRGLRGWLQTLYEVDARMRCSAPAQARADRLYRWLCPEHIQACRDIDALRHLAELLRGSRYRDYPFRYGLGRALNRSTLGILIVKAENHIAWIERGCPEREKGPALDPARLPDDRIDFLIQHHRDMAVVEALRAEKSRRLTRDERRPDAMPKQQA